MEIVRDLKPVEQVVFESYGTPLKAMRRIHLWRLADLHRIAYPPGAPKDIMLRLIENAEMGGLVPLEPPKGMEQETFWKIINGPRVEYDNYRGENATGQTNADIMRDIVEGKSYFETVEPANAPDERPISLSDGDPLHEKLVSAMNIRELRSEVKRRGLKQNIRMTADDLRAVLDGDTA